MTLRGSGPKKKGGGLGPKGAIDSKGGLTEPGRSTPGKGGIGPGGGGRTQTLKAYIPFRAWGPFEKRGGRKEVLG